MTLKELDKLVQRYRNGEKETFDAIFNETQTTVYLSVRAILSDTVAIEDLVQDTYMKALENLDKYQSGTNFKAWISKIARNIAINYFKREKKLEHVEIDDPVFNKESSDINLSYCLSLLEGIEREVVIYHLLLNMKFKDIAKILEVSTSHAFQIYKKALKKIKSEIK